MTKIVKNIPMMDLMAYLIESVDSPTHVGILQIYQPVNGSCAEIVQRVLAGYREAEVGPPFNYYPVFPRFGMPKWAEAEHFDSSYHIRHAAVPEPGAQQQLIDMIMDLHAGLIDRTRPGWIAYVIEGLEDDRFAVYWKVHHAYIDGASAIMRIDASVAKTPDDLEVRPLWGPLFAASKSSGHTSPGQRLSDAAQGVGAQAKAMVDIAQAVNRAVKQAGGRLDRAAPLPFSAPQSMFNKPVFATRRLGVGATGLDRFKAIARQEKVSINEVALTLVGAALDRYLQQHGSTPNRQLVAACPLAVRKPGDTDASTQIAAISVKLGDSKASIRDRLHQVHNSSRDAKDEAQQMSREALMNYLVLVGGAATLLSKSPLTSIVPPLSSVNVSNVAGPNYRCYLAGAELISSYPVSTLAGGTAINITFSSISGRMDYAVISDALAVPGAQEIADLMAAAMDELEAATIVQKNHGQKGNGQKKKLPPAKATGRKTPGKSGRSVLATPEGLPMFKVFKYLVISLALTAISQGSAAQVQYLNNSGALPPGLPFSEAVRVGNTLYLSGQIGVVPGKLELVPGGMAAEARQAMENIRAVLKANDLDMGNVVKCTIMLADMAQWGEFNKVYGSFFTAPFPARSAFGASGLGLGAQVEIDCIASYLELVDPGSIK